MDIDTAIRTIIENSPGIRAEYLVDKVIEKTGCARSTIYDHLGSLVAKHEIFRKGGQYYLYEPRGVESRLRKEHTKEIIAGLLALTGRGKYTITGEIVQDPGKIEVANQHLKTGYPTIFHLSTTDGHGFQKRLNRLIDELKNEDEMLRGYCKDCEARFPRRRTVRTPKTQKP